MSDFFSNLIRRSPRDSSLADPNGSLSTKSKQERRRAQVRNAQRKHRERRESYVNATNNSVRALRDFNRRLMEENAILQANVRSNHASPPVLPSGDDPEQGPGVAQHAPISAQAQLFQFRVSQKPTFQHESIEIRQLYGPGAEHVDQHYMSDSGMSSSQTPPLFASRGSSEPAGSIAAPTPVQSVPAVGSGENYYDGQQQQALTFAAADFILALEHPCMSHIHELADPTGSHNHTMSHQVLWSAPSSSSLTSSSASPAAQVIATSNDGIDTPPLQQHLQQGQLPLPLPFPPPPPESQSQNPLSTNLTDWATATTTLDKLISLSACLSLAHGEITPVQAWFKLLAHACFRQRCAERSAGILNSGGAVGGIDPGALERMLRELTDALRGEVKCYGFGAVLDEELFERLLARMAGAAGGNGR